jgi:predicted MFS family arabinose efflux permease
MADHPRHLSSRRPAAPIGAARRPAAAIGAVFFVNGATYSSWTPRLPELQQDLAISDGALGLTLVGMGLGGLAASAFSGRLVDRRGSRTTTVITSAAMSLWLPILGFAPTALAVFASLLVLGALDGLTDVAMNSQAVELDRRFHRSVVTRFHALWSAGAVAGGLVASRTAGAGISLHVQLVVTGVLLAAITSIAWRSLLPDRRGVHLVTDAVGDVLVTSRRALVTLFLVGVAIALAELPPNEWAALLMSDRFEISAGRAGLGFVAVAGGMLVGRLVGDRITDAMGLERTRRAGAAVAAAGVLLAATLPHPVAAGLGLFLTGIGLSTLFPLVFRAASDLSHGAHTGMASFSSGARLGFLLASPLIGLIAERSSVAVAIVVVAGTASVTVALVGLPRL